MTDRRSFLASLLCLPAALKAVGDMPPAIPSCSDGEYVTAWDPREYVAFCPRDYAGEWRWYHIDHRVGPPPSWFSEIIGPQKFPHGMGDTVRTPYDDQP